LLKLVLKLGSLAYPGKFKPPGSSGLGTLAHIEELSRQVLATRAALKEGSFLKEEG
jgi:hypothetical protein